MNGDFLTTKKYKWQEVSDSLQMLPLETVVRAETGEQRVQTSGESCHCRKGKGRNPDADTLLNARGGLWEGGRPSCSR